MSTEATGDARPDAADHAEQATASVSTRSDEVSGAVRDAGGAGEPGEGDEAGRGDAAGADAAGDFAAGDYAAGHYATGDYTAGGDADADGADGTGAGLTEPGPDEGDGADGDGDEGYGDEGYGDEDAADEGAGAEGVGAEGLEAEPEDAPDDADAPSELIDRAEPVELDEPGPALRPARRWTRVLVTLGFVVLAAAIVGGAIAIVGSVTHGFKKPVKVTYKKSALFSLKTGDCLDPSGQSYTLVSCDSPHDAEVFATFALPGGQWPGNTAVAADASSGCASRLTGYLNPELAISLASTYVYPDATAWQAGTRTVVCEVRAANGQLTGSVRGASATAG